MKAFTVHDNQAFRLRVTSHKCVSPDSLNAIEFIQESKNKNGEVDGTSTYQLFMTDSEISTLAHGLLSN